jgi:hypothetical protein
MKKTINLNFIPKKFFDPKLIILSIFLSLIISTASFFLQKNLKVFIVDVYFKNNIKTYIFFNEMNKLKINEDSEIKLKDILKLEYLKNNLSHTDIFSELKVYFAQYDLKIIENKLNGKIQINLQKSLNNSNFLSFKLIKNLDHVNEENTYYDKNSIRLIQDIKVIFNQFISEYLKKNEIIYEYLDKEDFVFVNISSVKEYKYNFLSLFSKFIFISLFINLILVLFKFRKNIFI